MQNMEIFDYVRTYNRQDADKLAEREQAILQRMDDEDQTRSPSRTFAVDEDNLARFVELLPLVNAGREWFQTNSQHIDAMQTRLDTAKAGDYLPRDEFMGMVNKINARKAKAKDFSPRYQAAKAEMQDLLSKEGSALWARWYQIDDHEQHLTDYLNQPMNNYFTWGGDDNTIDPEAVDSRHSPTDEIYADTHQQEMNEYSKPFQENPWLGGFWDWKQQHACEQASEQQSDEDQSIQALLTDDSACPF